MEKLFINGEEVIFGTVKNTCKCWHGGFSGGMHYKHVNLQRWDLPILELHGFIDADQSIAKITKDIQNEVNFDLEQRKKRELGIGA